MGCGLKSPFVSLHEVKLWTKVAALTDKIAVVISVRWVKLAVRFPVRHADCIKRADTATLEIRKVDIPLDCSVVEIVLPVVWLSRFHESVAVHYKASIVHWAGDMIPFAGAPIRCDILGCFDTVDGDLNRRESPSSIREVIEQSVRVEFLILACLSCSKNQSSNETSHFDDYFIES